MKTSSEMPELNITATKIQYLYWAINYGKPKFMKVLADVAGTDTEELYKILNLKEDIKMDISKEIIDVTSNVSAKPSKTHWTPELEAEVTKLYSEGLRGKAISEKINVPRGAVENKITKLIAKREPQEPSPEVKTTDEPDAIHKIIDYAVGVGKTYGLLSAIKHISVWDNGDAICGQVSDGEHDITIQRKKPLTNWRSSAAGIAVQSNKHHINCTANKTKSQ